MEKRTGREGGLPFPDSNGGMDLYGRRTQFEFDWGFCDTDINEVTRTRPVLRTRKKKEIARRSRTSFLSFDAATRPRTKAVPIRKDGYSIFSRLSAERRCSSIMAEACSPLLLLATLSTWPSLSTYPHQSLVAQYHSQTRRLLVHDTAFCLDTTPPSFPRTSTGISHIVVVGRISHSIVHLRYHVLCTTVTISNKSRIEAAPDLRLRSNSGFRFRFMFRFRMG